MLVVTETAQLTFVVAPILLHLDEELQKDLLLQEALHILAGLLAYTFQALALMAYYDTLLLRD